VYYVQMAHARLHGIFRVGEIDIAALDLSSFDAAALHEHEERELIKALSDFPSLVASAAQTMEPHRLTQYLLDTANLVHKWYHTHHVLDQPEPIRHARLVLARAAQVVLANGLTILGITAPERM
jgi:arginyl-tRNA synthetase